MLKRGRLSDGLANPPPWLTTLRSALEAAGFEPVEERRYGEPFGNYLVTLERGDVRIRPVKDRDEWRIDIWDARVPRREHNWERRTSGTWLRAVDAGITHECDVEYSKVDGEAAWISEQVDRVTTLILEPNTWHQLAVFEEERGRRLFGNESSE